MSDSKPLWDETRIETELAAHAETPRMTVDAARAILYQMASDYEADRVTAAQYIQAQASTIEQFKGQVTALTAERDYHMGMATNHLAQIASLEKQLFRATHPADVYATIKPDSAWTMRLSQHANIINNKHLWASNAAGTERLVANMPTLLNGLCLHMSEGFGVNVAWTDPSKPSPDNWGSFRNQLAFVKRTGLPCMMNLYCPPWWMRARGTQKMTSADAYKHNGRLMTSHIPQWQLMVEEGVTIFATAMLESNPDAVISLDINNEWKMFQEIRRGDTIIEGQRWADGDYEGTPGDVGDMDFPYYAKITYEAALRATRAPGIPDERVKCGGSYPVFTFQGTHNADSVPVGHPLRDRPYGTARKAALNAFERYLNYAGGMDVPVDFITIDAGTRNKDLSILTGDFSNCVRFRELTQEIRRVTDEYCDDKPPVFYKELYAKPQDEANDNPQYRGAIKVKALLEAARGGADGIYWWGHEGDGDDPGVTANGAIFNGVDKANGGEPTVIADMLREFAETLPVGATVYECEIEGQGIDVVATDSHWYVLNQTAQPMDVALDERVVSVGAHSWLTVERGVG